MLRPKATIRAHWAAIRVRIVEAALDRGVDDPALRFDRRCIQQEDGDRNSRDGELMPPARGEDEPHERARQRLPLDQILRLLRLGAKEHGVQLTR